MFLKPPPALDGRPLRASKNGSNGRKNTGSSSNASTRANPLGQAQQLFGGHGLPQRHLIAYSTKNDGLDPF